MLCADRSMRQQTLKEDVNAIRTTILHHADSKTETPPVQSGAASPLTYPFEIIPEYVQHAPLVVAVQMLRLTCLCTHHHAMVAI